MRISGKRWPARPSRISMRLQASSPAQTPRQVERNENFEAGADGAGGAQARDILDYCRPRLPAIARPARSGLTHRGTRAQASVVVKRGRLAARWGNGPWAGDGAAEALGPD